MAASPSIPVLARGTLPQTPFALDELIRGSMHLVEDHHLARKSGIPTSE